MPVGKFSGPALKYILKEEKITELEMRLGDESIPFLTHLRCISDLHQNRNAVKLKISEELINNFKMSFDFLYENFDMNITLKTHVIFNHNSYYFQWTGKTLRHTNMEILFRQHIPLSRRKIYYMGSK